MKETFQPKILFSYGCQKIDIEIKRIQKFKSFNIHGGLLPKYRGALPWPHWN